MSAIVKLWLYLSGKKTVISAVLLGVSDIFTAIGQQEAAEGIRKIGDTLLLIGLTHKGAKVIKGN